MIWIWSVPFLLTSSLYCSPQPVDLVSDIYYNAPPIIRAALVNVGINPRKDVPLLNVVNQVRPPPNHRLSSPLNPRFPFINDQQRRTIIPNNYLIPVSSTVRFGPTTRAPINRRQYFPRPIVQPPTVPVHHKKDTDVSTRQKLANPSYSQSGWIPKRTSNYSSLASQISSETVIRRRSNIQKLTELIKKINCGQDKEWCDMDDSYPQSDVGKFIEPCDHLTIKMYAPIPFAIPELDVKRRDDNITSFAHLKRSGQDYWRGSLCHTERRYARPSYARNTTGHWNVIIQTAKYLQRVPLEICRNEGGRCDKMANCAGDLRCVQKHNYQMLVSIDPKKPENCPSINLYEFPSSCICTVDRRSPVF